MLLALGLVGVAGAIYSISVGSGRPAAARRSAGSTTCSGSSGASPRTAPTSGPQDAETTITVFNDLQCAPCADYEINTIDPLVEQYARTGEARMEFRHFSLAPNDTTLAAIAAEAAGVQDRQWQYLDTFFRNQEAARTARRSTSSSCARSPRPCPSSIPTSGSTTTATRRARTASAPTRCSPPS